ncbi:transcription termination factor MTERF5, chloroplastic-like protein [Tanacetum coccineum]
MESEGIEVDDYILSTVLSACGDIEWKGDEYPVKYSVKSNSWIIGCVALLGDSGGDDGARWGWWCLVVVVVGGLLVVMVIGDGGFCDGLKMLFRELGFDYEKKISENILVLRKYGLSSHKIESLLLKNPGCLLQRVDWLDGVVRKVEPLLGIRPDSPRFLEGVQVVMCLSEATLDKKLGVFRSFGWTEDEIVRMTRSFPFCLTRSEGTIKAKLEWFKEEIGYGGEYLSSHPKLLVYSLEKRIVPRYQVLASLKEKNVLKSKLSLNTAVSLSEEKFVKDFVLPYREVVPCLYESYTNATGQKVKC